MYFETAEHDKKLIQRSWIKPPAETSSQISLCKREVADAGKQLTASQHDPSQILNGFFSHGMNSRKANGFGYTWFAPAITYGLRDISV